MNKLHRIAAVAVALVMASTLLVGCGGRNEEDIQNKISTVAKGCEKIIASESGDIFTYATLKVEKEIEGLFKNCSSETYVKYFLNGDSLDFSLSETYYTMEDEQKVAGDTYVFEKEGDLMVEFKNEVGDYAQTAPDIFEEIRIDFESADVESAAAEKLGKGVSRYTFVMTDDFANGFDREGNGDSVDCTKVVYTYDIDVMSILSKITKEYTYTLTHGGESQEMVIFVDIKTE